MSRQNPGISRQKSLIPWVSRDIPNFLAPTLSRGRPLLYRKISGPKCLGLGSFFVPETSVVLEHETLLKLFFLQFRLRCSFSRLVRRCREVSFVSCALPGFKSNTFYLAIFFAGLGLCRVKNVPYLLSALLVCVSTCLPLSPLVCVFVAFVFATYTYNQIHVLTLSCFLYNTLTNIQHIYIYI